MTPIKVLTDKNKMVINYVLETLAVMQVTHGDKDIYSEWFVGDHEHGDLTRSPYFLWTGWRSK